MAWALVGILGGAGLGVALASAGLSVVLRMLDSAEELEQPAGE